MVKINKQKAKPGNGKVNPALYVAAMFSPNNKVQALDYFSNQFLSC